MNKPLIPILRFSARCNQMSERKHKRGSEDALETETEETSFVLEPAQVEVGSGYALAVSYDENENPIVDVKTYGQVDLAQVRREIEQIFPNAQIRQLNRTRSVVVAKKNKRKLSAKK
jgi:hypothetical protein